MDARSSGKGKQAPANARGYRRGRSLPDLIGRTNRRPQLNLRPATAVLESYPPTELAAAGNAGWRQSGLFVLSAGRTRSILCLGRRLAGDSAAMGFIRLANLARGDEREPAESGSYPPRAAG